MADLFILPFRPAYDGNQKAIPGAQLWFTVEGSNTPSAPYTDETLTNPHTNPVVANGVGRWPPIYLDTAVSYRVRVYDEDAVAGVDTPLEEYDPYDSVYGEPDNLLRDDLLSVTGTDRGAGIVAYSAGVGWTAGTVGYELSKINSRSIGTVAAGTTQLVEPYATFTGHSGGTSDVRNMLSGNVLIGANSAVASVVHGIQNEARHTAGTLTYQYGIQGFNRLGLAGSTTGAVTTMRGVEWHLANEGSGNITDAFTFMDIGVDLADGTGTITTFNSFRSGDHGYTRITGVSYGFYQANCSVATTPITAAYGSEMSYGNLRWHFYLSGGASSWTAGRLRIGGSTPAAQPTDFLEVVGGIRAQSVGGTVASIGFSGTGTGGAVTQATSKSTGVTLNKPTGQITMHNASLAADTIIGFNLTNDQIAATDVVNVTIASGVAAGGSYVAWVDAVNAGSCRVILWNRTAGALGEAVVLNFVVLKGANA